MMNLIVERQGLNLAMEEVVRIGVDASITDRPGQLLDLVRRTSATVSNPLPRRKPFETRHALRWPRRFRA